MHVFISSDSLGHGSRCIYWFLFVTVFVHTDHICSSIRLWSQPESHPGHLSHWQCAPLIVCCSCYHNHLYCYSFLWNVFFLNFFRYTRLYFILLLIIRVSQLSLLCVVRFH